MKSVREIRDPALGKYIRFIDALDGGTIKTGKVVGKVGLAYKLDTGDWFNFSVGDSIIYYGDKPFRDRETRKQGDAMAAVAKSMRETKALKRRILTNYMFVGIGVAFGILIGLAF